MRGCLGIGRLSWNSEDCAKSTREVLERTLGESFYHRSSCLFITHICFPSLAEQEI